MKAIFTAFFLFLICNHIAGSVWAFDSQDLENFELLKICENCDLSEANLKYGDLKNAVLKNSNLEGANLHAADLSGADLTGANLKMPTFLGRSKWSCTPWCGRYRGRIRQCKLLES